MSWDVLRSPNEIQKTYQLLNKISKLYILCTFLKINTQHLILLYNSLFS